MMRLCLFMMTVLLLAVPGAQAKPLVADMSGYRIAINSSFTGTHLLLFGTRNDPGDIVVVVRGPSSEYMVRKKEQVGGVLWLNRKKQKLEDVPDFYMVLASRPFKDIKDGGLFDMLNIGLQKIVGEGKPDFVNAFLAYQQSVGLYSLQPQRVSFMDESLFKVVLPFPDNVPHGYYSVEVYLINDGVLTSMQSIPLQVERTGLDALIYGFAHSHGVLYGLFATAMALALGLGASRLLHK